MTYNERLESWQKGVCPYCGGKAVETDIVKGGGAHYRCNNPDCKAENHFSRRNIGE